LNNSKFTVNALVLIVLIFSAIGMFFTIRLVTMADKSVVNVFEPIEGTELSVRYATFAPDGLYSGDAVNGTLKLAGRYGYGWGAAVFGDRLIINELKATPFGMTVPSVVCVDLNTFEKTTLLKNATLRGVCASGEPVCLAECMSPSDFPKTNALSRLYAAGSRGIRPETDAATVVWLDPETGGELFRLRDETALVCDFDSRYLDRTLGEAAG
jgi:hypothetical protein